MEANTNYQVLANGPIPRQQESRPSYSGPRTPVLRRSQIETYTRSANHDSLVQSCEFTLVYEAIVLAYLSICMLKSDDPSYLCGFDVK